VTCTESELDGQLEALRLSDLCCEMLQRNTISEPSIASPFWAHILPQLSQHSRVLHYATVAAGAAFEAHLQEKQHPSLQLVRYYGQAVRHIQSELAAGEVASTPLAASCLLLALTDVLASHETQALAHLKGTLALLQRRQSSLLNGDVGTLAATQRYIIHDEIDAAAAILDLSTSTYAPDEPCRLPGLDTRHFRIYAHGARSRLAHLELRIIEALHRCYSWCNHAGSNYRFAPYRMRPASVSIDQGRHAGYLTLLIQELGEVLSELDTRQRSRALLLRMQCSSAYVHVATGLDPHECIYDTFTRDFRSIVQDAETVGRECDDRQARLHSGAPVARMLPDIGTIAPLFHVAQRCRHPHIRRRALALLTQSRFEGPWSTAKMSPFAFRAMEIEEGQASMRPEDFEEEDCLVSTFIPEQHRLTGFGIVADAISDGNTAEATALFTHFIVDDYAMQASAADTGTLAGRWLEWRERLSLRRPLEFEGKEASASSSRD